MDKINTHQKGSNEEELPHRMALTRLTRGDPMQRTMNNYAKSTPGVGQGSPNIMAMGGMGGGH